MDRRGFILVEASVVYVILGLTLVALMPMFIMGVRAGSMTQDVALATQLAVELLEEVRMRRWDEASAASLPAPSGSALGSDPGESPEDKKTFNDVDDFDGWTEKPPSDPLGEPLPDSFSRFTRSVSVRYVDASLAPSAASTDHKQVTVCVSTERMKPVCLDAALSNR